MFYISILTYSLPLYFHAHRFCSMHLQFVSDVLILYHNIYIYIFISTQETSRTIKLRPSVAKTLVKSAPKIHVVTKIHWISNGGKYGVAGNAPTFSSSSPQVCHMNLIRYFVAWLHMAVDSTNGLAKGRGPPLCTKLPV